MSISVSLSRARPRSPSRGSTLLTAFAGTLAMVLAACGTAAPPAPVPAGARVVAVEVGARGYTPAEVSAAPGEVLHLVFTRTSDEGCGQQLVFPDLDLRRDLPLDEPVAVDITTPATGRLGFTCGMDMYRGAIVVH